MHQRIDHCARAVRRGELRQLNCAGLDVDLDLGHLHAHGRLRPVVEIFVRTFKTNRRAELFDDLTIA